MKTKHLSGFIIQLQNEYTIERIAVPFDAIPMTHPLFHKGSVFNRIEILLYDLHRVMEELNFHYELKYIFLPS